MKNYLLLLYSLLLMSCTETYEPYQFERSEAISFNPLNYPALLGYTVQLIHEDGDLFIYDFYGDTLITQFDLEKEQIKKKWVTIGNGPGELNNPLDMQYIDRRLYLLGRSQHLMTHLSFENDTTLFVKDFQLPDASDRFVALTPTQFVFSGFWDNRYVWMNRSDSDSLVGFGDYPSFWEEEKTIPSSAKAMFHQSMFAKHPSEALFASGSWYVLEIFRYDPAGVNPPQRQFQKQLGRYSYDHTSGNMVTATVRPGSDLAVSGICCSEKYIYLIRPLTTASCEILVVNWAGEPVMKLESDKYVSCLTIDEKAGKGYACITDPEDRLVWFDLPDMEE